MIAFLRGTPRSPRTVVLWLALWLTIVGNFALWRELWQIGSGGNTFSVVAPPGVFVIVFATTVALFALTAWGQPMKAPALLYMSDHGESLGEHGNFLHGLPYSISPEVQKKVPFVAWLGDALVARHGVDLDCLRGRANAPLSHDNLFHTALGVLDVTTPTYVRALDAFAPCRKPS